MEIRTSPWNDKSVAELRKYFARNLSCSQIAAALGNGITRNAVIGKLNRIGLTTHRPRRTPEEIAESKTRKYRIDNNRKMANRFRQSKVRQLMARVEKAVAPEPVTGGKDLLELGPYGTDCRWPIGERPFRFCGCPSFEGLPYCAPHSRTAYRGRA